MPTPDDSPFGQRLPEITPVELRQPADPTPDLRPIEPAPRLDTPIPPIERHVKDPKTTITALITGLAGVLAYFGVAIPESLLPYIILAGTVAIGIFAKDGKAAGDA